MKTLCGSATVSSNDAAGALSTTVNGAADSAPERVAALALLESESVSVVSPSS
jgi:hypothetical protein